MEENEYIEMGKEAALNDLISISNDGHGLSTLREIARNTIEESSVKVANQLSAEESLVQIGYSTVCADLEKIASEIVADQIISGVVYDEHDAGAFALEKIAKEEKKKKGLSNAAKAGLALGGVAALGGMAAGGRYAYKNRASLSLKNVRNSMKGNAHESVTGRASDGGTSVLRPQKPAVAGSGRHNPRRHGASSAAASVTNPVALDGGVSAGIGGASAKKSAIKNYHNVAAPAGPMIATASLELTPEMVDGSIEVLKLAGLIDENDVASLQSALYGE